MQSIIVYRNPLEAALWEGLMSGSFFPVIVGIVVFFALFLTINRLIVEKYFNRRSQRPAIYAALVLSAIAGAAVMMCMV